MSETLTRTAVSPEIPSGVTKSTDQIALESYFAAIGELDGIIEKVEQNLFDAALISDGLAQTGIDKRTKGKTFLFCRGRYHAQNLRDGFAQVEPLRGDFELPRFDLGDIEHVVDERQQVTGTGADHFELLGLLRIQGPGQPLEDDAGETDD